MMDSIILVALGYFIYSNIKTLIEYDEGPWQLVQYLMLGITVVMGVLFVVYGIRMIKKAKQQKENAPAEREEALRKQREEAERRRAQFRPDFFDDVEPVNTLSPAEDDAISNEQTPADEAAPIENAAVENAADDVQQDESTETDDEK